MVSSANNLCASKDDIIILIAVRGHPVLLNEFGVLVIREYS